MKIFDYEDIQLIPNKCIVNSRSECDTTVQFGPKTFKLPVVPANMQTVMNESLAEWFAENDYFYIMHRFDEAGRIPFIKKMQNKGLFASISVGVKETEFEFIEKLKTEHLIPEYITIDIAHGHANSVINMIKHIKKHIPQSFVIADGGIRTHGDIAKSIRFGATMVMIGSLFAAHEESPGKTVELDGKRYKEYFGSASEFQKGEHKNVEGKKMFVEHKGSLKDTLVEMQQDLQSSISYAGGKDLKSLTTVDYVIVRNSIFNGDRD
ncbi:IMP dehydrogenase [Staphylococcus hominis]|uniref:IMP dehydrogenase n=1 Tax=Staphylococcus hominis TaxID=1290 RepID=UPI003018B8E3